MRTPIILTVYSFLYFAVIAQHTKFNTSNNQFYTVVGYLSKYNYENNCATNCRIPFECIEVAIQIHAVSVFLKYKLEIDITHNFLRLNSI